MENPYATPNTNSEELLTQQKRGFRYHGPFALVLLVAGMIIRICASLIGNVESNLDPSAIYIVSILGTAFWMWGFIHLAKYLRLHLCWGLLGFFYMIGVGIIFVVARVKKQWDAYRVENPKPKEYQGDPDSPY